jgi:dihydrofolate synthase/folylpolyglutamate synthase
MLNVNYQESLRFIHEIAKFGSKLGLENIRELLRRLGNPQKSLKFIHVAGTNGKGSVTASLASVLFEAGYTVGRYTSPFIYEFNERIAVNNKNIDNESLAEITTLVAEKCGEMVKDGFNHPTEFEVVTAIGMVYFHRCKCDCVVLEVGLGGRLDATNVIDAPLVSVITAVDFDHMEHLGNTHTEIAFEKCGIIKEGAPVAIYCEQAGEALSEILRVCRERGCGAYIAEKPEIKKDSFLGCVFDCGRYKNVFTPLIGEHMAKNMSLVLLVIDILREQGLNIPDEAVYEGLYRVYWPARFETAGKNPLLVMDGAHNISGMAALAGAVKKFFPAKDVTLVMGMLRDKEYEKALKIISPYVGRIITVTVPSPRSLSAEELLACAKGFTENAEAAQSIDNAMEKAFCYGRPIVAAGSLYMLADIKKAYDKVKKDNEVS